MSKTRIWNDFLPVGKLYRKDKGTIYFGIDNEGYALYINGDRIHPTFKVYLTLWEVFQKLGYTATIFYRKK